MGCNCAFKASTSLTQNVHVAALGVEEEAVPLEACAVPVPLKGGAVACGKEACVLACRRKRPI